MSVKIKINWDNENVVSESVRIYRADSAFTPVALPPLLNEIFGDVYEYEDLDTIQNQNYFYMLSAKLGEQEVFTECFEVKATPAGKLPDISHLASLSFTQMLETGIQRPRSYLKSGGFTYYTGLVFAAKGKIYQQKPSRLVYKEVHGDVLSLSLSSDGSKALVRTNNGSGSSASVAIYSMVTPFDIESAAIEKLVNNFVTTGYASSIFAHQRAIITAENFLITTSLLANEYDIDNVVSNTPYNIKSKLNLRAPGAELVGVKIAENGMLCWVLTGVYNNSSASRLHILSFVDAFDFSTCYESHFINLNNANYPASAEIGIDEELREIYIGSAEINFLKATY